MNAEMNADGTTLSNKKQVFSDTRQNARNTGALTVRNTGTLTVFTPPKHSCRSKKPGRWLPNCLTCPFCRAFLCVCSPILCVFSHPYCPGIAHALPLFHATLFHATRARTHARARADRERERERERERDGQTDTHIHTQLRLKLKIALTLHSMHHLHTPQ